MRLQRLLRGLIAPEFLALAEKIESLDPCDDDARSLLASIHHFVVTEGRPLLHLHWHERLILRRELRIKQRAVARIEAMGLVMRVPSERPTLHESIYATGQHTFDSAPMKPEGKVVIRRKDRYAA